MLKFHGEIYFGDLHISFEEVGDLIDYTLHDIPTGEKEELSCDFRDFLITLAVCTHPDGFTTQEDWEIAESIQNNIRWIP